MKRIRKSVGILLFMMSLMCSLTACYGGNNNQTQSAPVTESAVPDETGGVIDGLMDEFR